MSILDNDKIDIVIPDDKSDSIVLVISDHLDWTNTGEHLLLLQDKINKYLSYIESEEIYEKFPKSKNLNKIIRVVGKYILNNEAKKFYNEAQKIVIEAGFDLEFILYSHLADEK